MQTFNKPTADGNWSEQTAPWEPNVIFGHLSFPVGLEIVQFYNDDPSGFLAAVRYADSTMDKVLLGAKVQEVIFGSGNCRIYYSKQKDILGANDD